MPMKSPVHPGKIIRHDCLVPLGLTVTAAAKVLRVSRQALNNLLNGKAGVTPEMAIRLEKAFGGTADTWLRMQMNYDLARAMKAENKIKVTRYNPPVRQPDPGDGNK
ncbi:MAG: addiction module antidote protein, HigA family [Acidobacteria bacterium]|nr:MAG: addiction module antidote protein, HigA family [Acidobacteriota bacterium]PYT84256.1 MAG: addiction module antidote protein, HigA family [Acidobacteriota bacterium]